MQRQSEQEQLSSVFIVFARPLGRGDPENLNKVAYLNIAVADC